MIAGNVPPRRNSDGRIAAGRFDPARLARSNLCIGIDLAMVAFTAFTFYIALFDRPPLCDDLCLLMALPPLSASFLWSIWLLLWHWPHWRTMSPAHRALVPGCVLVNLCLTAFFFSH